MDPTRDRARNAAPSDPASLFDVPSDRPYHVCGFFHDTEEKYRVLLPFIREGFERGERAFHVEYETRFNQLTPHPDPVVCAYDLARFRATW